MTFGDQTTTDEVLEGRRLDGITAVVTGASTGLGWETSRALAAAGAHVLLAVRDTAKGESAVAEIRAQSPEASVEFGVVDLASLSSVREFAIATLAAHPRIDLLVNNAGVMFTPFGHTADGFELQFGTNHLGHFVLTGMLMPALLAAAPARIVNLSSGGHQGSDIIWDDPNYEHREYDKFEAYGQSKTANILFTVELDARLSDRGIRSYAVHPGMIATELGRHMTRDDMRALRDRAKAAPAGGLPAYKSIPAGAATTVWAATAPELAGLGGVYLADCQLATPNPWALDRASASRLWTLSEQLVGQRFEV
ncbi:MAG: oxidoreductase, short-chain dehydrogenase/reductase family protein [Acidimicrobiales bacterium]|nr:oxidoreductase, short-chain dehydrogenase/reductase family protein [Acidimicrobiales bacterium]